MQECEIHARAWQHASTALASLGPPLEHPNSELGKLGLYGKLRLYGKLVKFELGKLGLYGNL